MTSNEEQLFLNELEKKLWTSANKLLPSLDASQYKHVMLGLVFLKYVSDAFDIRRKQLKEQLQNPENEYFLDPDDFGGVESAEHKQEVAEEGLVSRDQNLLDAPSGALGVSAKPEQGGHHRRAGSTG